MYAQKFCLSKSMCKPNKVPCIKGLKEFVQILFYVKYGGLPCTIASSSMKTILLRSGNSLGR